MGWMERGLPGAYLAKARESLVGAESEHAARRYNNAANRCYYACYQAAVAALTNAGVHPLGTARSLVPLGRPSALRGRAGPTPEALRLRPRRHAVPAVQPSIKGRRLHHKRFRYPIGASASHDAAHDRGDSGTGWRISMSDQPLVLPDIPPLRDARARAAVVELS